MAKLLNQQLGEILVSAGFTTTLKCESALRVAAATLFRAAPHEITATTIVCDLQGGDADTFEWLVQEIADEYVLQVRIREQPESYSVRFSRPQVPLVPVRDEAAGNSMLARLLRR